MRFSGLVASAFVLLLCVPNLANAWLCDDGGSQRQGATILACGSATEATQQAANLKALKAAHEEFQSLCSFSDDCKNYKVRIVPKRSECKKTGENYECKRLIAVSVSLELRTPSSNNALADSTTESPISAALPKMHKGMSKSEIIKAFGKPDLYQDVDNTFTIINYADKPFCESRCTMALRNDRVYKFDGFKLEYTDLLDEKSIWQKMFEN